MNYVSRAFRNFTIIPGRPVVGVVIHDTEGTSAITTLQVTGASWHWLIDRNGAIYQDVLETHAAWHVAATGHTTASLANTRWRPDWLPRAPAYLGVSDANYATVGIELVGAQEHRDAGEPYTEAQYASLRVLLADIRQRRGSMPCVGHGQLQRDRTDPVAFDWARAGLELRGDTSYWPQVGAPLPPAPPEGEDMATIAELEGIIREYEGQVAALRQEIAGKDSELGALRNDVLVPLEAELANVKHELAACQQAAHAPPGVTHITLEGAVHFVDGTRLLVPVAVPST